MPASAATSSIEVPANPVRAKAAAAAVRIWAWRSSRCISRRVVVSVTPGILTLVRCIRKRLQFGRGTIPGGTSMTTAQVTFTETELLADHDIAEPLIANGVRCHGGFDEDGSYVSP